MMLEKIGNVTIDTSQWPGEEMYSDGPIEQELLQRLQAGERARDILLNDNRYAMLYHLTRERENILSWYPFSKDMSVLEIGAGCGAITGLLSKMCGKVTSVDISLTRSRINANRNREARNLHLLVANAEDLPEEPIYDIVTLIGVFEYSSLFVQKENPFVFLLEHYRKMIKPNGHLLIAIENQFGLKYMLGAREDHHWQVNEGLYDYPHGGARTFSRSNIDKLLKDAGFETRQFVAAYPDYKIPYQIISEDIPKSMQCEFSIQPDYGEFAFYSADIHRVMQTATQSGLGIELANSFFICAGSKPVILPYYVKYASMRKDAYALRTELYHDGTVKKIPLCLDNEVVNNLLDGYKLLNDSLPAQRIAKVSQAANMLLVEKVNGISLIEAVKREDSVGKQRLFSAYIELCKELLLDKTTVNFSEAEAFKAIFGCIDSPPMLCVKPAPIDLNMSNIIVENGKWVLIDTEWVFDFAVPYKYIIWRAAYLYNESTGDPHAEFLAIAEITDDEIKIFQQMEAEFGKYVFDASSPRSYNARYYTQRPSTKDCMEIMEALHNSEALVETINRERETAWQQFSERETLYNDELKKRLQAEESNRQLSMRNDELAAKLEEAQRMISVFEKVYIFPEDDGKIQNPEQR